MLPLFFSKGQFIDSLPLTDRSIHYGDGVFETIAISDNKPELLSAHLDRLEQACQCLKIPYAGHQAIVSEIKSLLCLQPQQRAVLKILISRGSGGRGYNLPDIVKPSCLLGLYTFPNDIDCFAQKGINVFLCKTRLAYNSSIAGIKHLNRLEQVLATTEFDSSIYQEGFMFDGNDNLIEGTKSNIFIMRQGVLQTPALSGCGVEGIMKKLILGIAQDSGIKTIENTIKLEMLNEADEVFVCNSIIRLWPVTMINQRSYRIGAITQELAKVIATKSSYYENF